MRKKDYKRIEELLDRVTPDQSEVIGLSMPTGLERPGKEHTRAYNKYIEVMKDFGYTREEARELLTLSNKP